MFKSLQYPPKKVLRWGFFFVHSQCCNWFTKLKIAAARIFLKKFFLQAELTFNKTKRNLFHPAAHLPIIQIIFIGPDVAFKVENSPEMSKFPLKIKIKRSKKEISLTFSGNVIASVERIGTCVRRFRTCDPQVDTHGTALYPLSRSRPHETLDEFDNLIK